MLHLFFVFVPIVRVWVILDNTVNQIICYLPKTFTGIGMVHTHSHYSNPWLDGWKMGNPQFGRKLLEMESIIVIVSKYRLCSIIVEM